MMSLFMYRKTCLIEIWPAGYGIYLQKSSQYIYLACAEVLADPTPCGNTEDVMVAETE